jgi:hypothetical protein
LNDRIAGGRHAVDNSDAYPTLAVRVDERLMGARMRHRSAIYAGRKVSEQWWRAFVERGFVAILGVSPADVREVLRARGIVSGMCASDLTSRRQCEAFYRNRN